ncbi:MAG: tetratricopeptide repeat protein [Verrucomicrobiota bacterium]
MKRIGLMLFAGFSIFLLPDRVRAQSDDPSEVFLKAYMTAQQGEKLEHENQFKDALAKFRFAGSLLEELRKAHSDWQPAIVEYRTRKIGESILRVEAKVSTQKDFATTSTPAPEAPAAAPPGNISSPPLPQQSAGPAEPSVELVPIRPSQVRATPPASDAAIKDATKRLREKIDALQADLQKSRKELSAAQKDKDSVSGRLQETNVKLEKAQKELDKTKAAEGNVRDQLAKAQESLGRVKTGGKGDVKAEAALREEIAQLKKALASAQTDKTSAEQEKTAAAAKLDDANKQITSVTQERDAAVAQLKGSKDVQERFQTLITENSDLKQKLADAEKTVREIGEDKPKKEQELAEVKRQLEQLRQQLAFSKKQNQDSEVTIADLRAQLDEASGELEKVKLTGGNPEETARLTRENELLRGIVVRERQEDARREQAKKLMIAEFDKLKIKSDVLDQQIEMLAQPITKLTPEELSLLRLPDVGISDNNPATLKASFTMAKNTQGPGAVANPDSTAQPAENGSTPPGPNVETTFRPGVPENLIPVAREAKEDFDNGKFRAAEKAYEQILAKSPNNLYSLSNLGVVLFRTGKLKAAELTLKKAITIAPKDEFSRTTLGIVYYRQSKFDDALTELTKALAINPKSATAHNYLGITASQKGWQEAAEKEMLDAVASNPDYADAHFNLAVVYATANPPAKELAKRHYTKATSLGAEPDPSLEKLIR